MTIAFVLAHTRPVSASRTVRALGIAATGGDPLIAGRAEISVAELAAQEVAQTDPVNSHRRKSYNLYESRLSVDRGSGAASPQLAGCSSDGAGKGNVELRFSASMIFGLSPNGSGADDIRMAYIVTRNSRFYVVAYDGIDPLTGRERRRWHPAGASRTDAEAIAATLEAAASPPPDASTRSLTVGRFLSEQWMPRRRTQLRVITAHRYEWMIDNYWASPRRADGWL